MERNQTEESILMKLSLMELPSKEELLEEKPVLNPFFY
jgi:hypothetical protein